jgi:hypothetical protein
MVFPFFLSVVNAETADLKEGKKPPREGFLRPTPIQNSVRGEQVGEITDRWSSKIVRHCQLL